MTVDVVHVVPVPVQCWFVLFCLIATLVADDVLPLVFSTFDGIRFAFLPTMTKYERWSITSWPLSPVTATVRFVTVTCSSFPVPAHLSSFQALIAPDWVLFGTIFEPRPVACRLIATPFLYQCAFDQAFYVSSTHSCSPWHNSCCSSIEPVAVISQSDAAFALY